MILRSARLYVIAGLLASFPGLRAQNTPAPLPQTVRAVTPTGPNVQASSTSAPVAANNPDEIVGPFKISNVDIDVVLDALKLFSGRSIMHGPLAVQPNSFSIDLPTMPASEMISALESFLTLNNIAVIPQGDRYFKVVNITQGKTEAPLFISGSALDLPPSDQIATKIFQLNFLRVEELFNPALNTIFTQGIQGSMVVLQKANAAMVTDTVSNLQRLELLVNQLDHPEATGFKPIFYQLQNGAKASDIVLKIHTLLAGPAGNRVGTATSYLADDRTNQVIVLCNQGEEPFFSDLIRKLDVAAAPNTKNEVISLKYADATVLTQTLVALVSGQNAAAQKVTSQSVRPGETAPPAPPAPGPIGGITANAAHDAAAAAGTNEFSTLITIEADERSNSIVVSGTSDDIRLIHELIDKLDGPLPQVRIEVIIAEVTLSDTDISGISSLGLTVGPNAKTGATQITNFAGGGTNSAIPGTSVAGFDLSSGVVNPLAFNAALNATSAGGKNLVHILQAMTVYTAHNKKAEVDVGQEVPIINGGQSTLATAGTTPVNSFNSTYTTVTIDLKVLPLVSDNGEVQLDVDQAVNDIEGETTIQAGDTQPIIGTREAKTFITCRSGQMVVLGGLQKTTKSTTQNKIGFLYEIPILSQLLGGHTDDLERTELLFFIRPLIVGLEDGAPPDTGTADVYRRIDEMTDKTDIRGFLKNPTPPKPESKTQNLIDRFKD